MKTARRALCIALVMVMAVGLVQFAGAGTFARYIDGDNVKYTEAVDVLTGIKVIEGTDGAFRPADPVTRAEAAAIITRMLLTREVADSLPVSATGFSDVATGHWAAKYISYCSSQGIIRGRPDGKFYPADRVTAAEFVIMLMRALNIGDPDRYVGANWDMNAVLDGMESGILNTNVDYTRPATREEIAQYAFNGLVYSSAGSSDKIWGITSYKTNAGGIIEFEYGWITVPGSAPDSLISKKYPALESNIDDVDDLGRPATTWRFQKNIISTQVSAPIATFNTAVTQHDLYKETGLGADMSKAAVKIDAVINQAGAQDSKAALTSLRNSNASANAAVYGSNGNGIITELYKVKSNGTSDAYKVVVIKPTFAEVDIKATAATATVGAFNTYSFNAKDFGKVYTSHVDAAHEADEVSISGSVAKSDRVLYYWGKDTLYIESVRTITGTIVSISNAGVVSINGTTTYKAGAYAGEDLYPSNDEGTYFVDTHGFILGIKESVDISLRIALVISTDTYSVLEDGKVIAKYFVTMADANGKVTTVSADTDYKDALNGAVCSYTINTRSGEYEFTRINNNVDTVVGSYKVRTGNVTRIEKGNPEMVVSGAHTVNLAGNATKFYIINSDETVTIVTGINSISTMSLSKTTSVSLGPNNTSPKAVADIVFVYDGNKSEADSEFVFYLGTYERRAEGVTIDVHKSGTPGTLPGIAEGAAGLGQLREFQLYKSITVNTSGAVTAIPITSSDTVIRGSGLFEFDGGMLFFKGSFVKMVDDDIPVYTITASGGVRSMQSGLAKEISVTLRSGGYAYVVETLTGNALAVYIFNL